MKRLIAPILVASLVATVAVLLINLQRTKRQAQQLESAQATWAAEKAALQAALDGVTPQVVYQPASTLPAAKAIQTPDPKALLNQLTHYTPGSAQDRSMRPVIALLEQLAQIGPPTLPIIGEYLDSGEDITYVPASGKGGMRNVKSLADALAPSTLRFGLFDVARQIGGAEAEQILTKNLTVTKRGIEVAYLTELLEAMSPGTYKEQILATVRSLLADGNRAERDYLFSVLQRFNDNSFVAVAQGQVIQSDGKVDRGALRYLQQTLGEQSVAVAANMYQDSRLSEAGSKEPLARVALAYVGENEQARQLYHTALLDPSLQPDQKRELVEDLNQDGLGNTKNPSPEDLRVIANRYALTQAYLQQDYVLNDTILNAAFHEAEKDLRKMLERAAANANAIQSGR